MMPKLNRLRNVINLLTAEKGVVHILALMMIVAAVGIISYLLISATAPFNNNLANSLNLKNNSYASSPTPTLSNITYETVNGQNMLLDVWQPPSSLGTGPFPGVLLIHGGGFVMGDKFADPGIAFTAQTLANSGFVVFSINYRLVKNADGTAPTMTQLQQGALGVIDVYPAAVTDAKAAVLWVRANAATYHVNPQKVAAFGGSAGATLALTLASTGTAGGDRVEAAVSWSAPTNFPLMYQEGQSNSNTALAAKALAYFVGCNYLNCTPTWQQASPITHLDSQTVPIFLVNSDNEQMPITQATSEDSQLTSLGITHRLKIITNSTAHSFAYASVEAQESAQMLQQYLGVNVTPLPSSSASPTPSPSASPSPSPSGCTIIYSASWGATATNSRGIVTVTATLPTTCSGQQVQWKVFKENGNGTSILATNQPTAVYASSSGTVTSSWTADTVTTPTYYYFQAGLTSNHYLVKSATPELLVNP